MTTLLSRRSALPTAVEDFFETGKLFPSVFDFNNDWLNRDFSVRIPSVNILDNKDHFKIELAAPGLEKKDFKIEVENGYLTISAKKEEEKKEEKENYSKREFSYNSFSRSFALPEFVITDKIDAQYMNGVLKLMVPKKEGIVTKSKKEIKVS